MALTVLAILMIRSGSFGDIPNDVTFKDILAAGPTWTLTLGGLAGLGMVVIGILGIHAANHDLYRRAQVLWGLGVAALGCGIAAIPVGVILDGSRSAVAWVFLALGTSIFLLGLSECWLEVERESE